MSEFVNKVWGYEEIVVNNERYCGKRLTVLPNGMTSSLHYHESKTETFWVLTGELHLELFDIEGSVIKHKEERVLKVGDTLTLTPFHPHRFWSEKGVCQFMEFSTHSEDFDSKRVVQGGPRLQTDPKVEYTVLPMTLPVAS